MDKDVQYIIIFAVVLIVVGTVAIVVLGEEGSAFEDLDLSTGFGFIPEEVLGLPIGWVASGLLLVVALLLFYQFVWRKR
jgi:hypothetical protein